jgi:hypothetical protein
MASALTYSERYHKDSDEFLSHIVQVKGDETWVLVMNVETQKSQSNSSNKPKKLKQTLSVRKLMATVFWEGKGTLMGELMQQDTTRTLEVHCETL